MNRRLIVLLLALWIVAPTRLALAGAADDAAAEKRIEAATESFLTAQFKKADKGLRAVLTKCAKRCSAPVMAKAWMYIGLVQSIGYEDQAAARKSFDRALELDARAALDEELATPDATKVFKEAQVEYQAKHPSAAPPPSSSVSSGSSGGPAAMLLCTPDVQEVEMRRPIPVACPLAPGSSTATLYYTNNPEGAYKAIPMKGDGRRATATIPCSATMNMGAVLLYVIVKDLSGETDFARWGSEDEPIIIQVVNATKAQPPAFPGKPPPKRCPMKDRCKKGSKDCLAEGVGLKGDPCGASDECSTGLYCKDSVCAPAPACTRGTDCPLGECANGFCVMEIRDPSEERALEDQDMPARAGPAAARTNWVGLHIAADFALVSGKEICAKQGWNDGFRCYNDEGQTLRTNGDDQPEFSSDLSMKPILAGPRVLASYERVMTEQVTAGARLGLAFGGSPKNFLPFHGELFGSYWLAPLNKPGLRPYVGAGIGIAQVDAPVQVTNVPDNAPDDYDGDEYDAYKKMGRTFLRLGGGAVYDVTDRIGIQGNLNIMYFLPSTGLVLQPSIGGVYGF